MLILCRLLVPAVFCRLLIPAIFCRLLIPAGTTYGAHNIGACCMQTAVEAEGATRKTFSTGSMQRRKRSMLSSSKRARVMLA